MLRLLRWGRLRKQICGTHGKCFLFGSLVWTSPAPTDLRITCLPLLYNGVFSTATTVLNSQEVKTSWDARGLFYLEEKCGAHLQTNRPTLELHYHVPNRIILHVHCPRNSLMTSYDWPRTAFRPVNLQLCLLYPNSIHSRNSSQSMQNHIGLHC